MEAFLVAFRNNQGQMDSRVVYVMPGYVKEVALTLLMLLPGVTSWDGWSFLPQDIAPRGANHRSQLVYVVGNAERVPVILEHDQPIRGTDDLRGIENNIRASLNMSPETPLCVVQCGPVYQD
jgi:hypothetical protein